MRQRTRTEVILYFDEDKITAAGTRVYRKTTAEQGNGALHILWPSSLPLARMTRLVLAPAVVYRT